MFASEIPNGTAPFNDDYDHAKSNPNETCGRDWKFVSGETSLDLQAAFPIVYPQNITLYDSGPNADDILGLLNRTIDDRVNGYNRFLDAIDGSYCTYEQREKGRRPSCGVFKPTNVISASYGSPERLFTPFWQQRQCNEYLKLGLQGVSLFYCSQDEGASFLGIEYVRRLTRDCKENNGTGPRVFMPSFPAACP